MPLLHTDNLSSYCQPFGLVQLLKDCQQSLQAIHSQYEVTEKHTHNQYLRRLCNRLQTLISAKDYSGAYALLSVVYYRLNFEESSIPPPPTSDRLIYFSIKHTCTLSRVELSAVVELFHKLFRIAFQSTERLKQRALSRQGVRHSSQPGTTYIHQIWLGKSLSLDELQAYFAHTIAIAKHWHNFSSPRHAANVKVILWTDSRPTVTLFEAINQRSNFEVRHIDNLCKMAGYHATIVTTLRVLHYRGEYAHAADLLRVLILFFYGGLYLDFTWKRGLLGYQVDPETDTFSFSQNDLKFCSLQNCLYSTFDFASNNQDAENLGNLRAERQEKTQRGLKEEQIIINALPDIGIIYVGRPGHPFFNQIISALTQGLASAGYREARPRHIQFYHTDRFSHLPEKEQSKMLLDSQTVGETLIWNALVPTAISHFYTAQEPMYFAMPDKNQLPLYQLKNKHYKLWRNHSLGLSKFVNQSWRRNSPKLFGSAESPAALAALSLPTPSEAILDESYLDDDSCWV